MAACHSQFELFVAAQNELSILFGTVCQNKDLSPIIFHNNANLLSFSFCDRL